MPQLLQRDVITNTGKYARGVCTEVQIAERLTLLKLRLQRQRNPWSQPRSSSSPPLLHLQTTSLGSNCPGDGAPPDMRFQREADPSAKRGQLCHRGEVSRWGWPNIVKMRLTKYCQNEADYQTLSKWGWQPNIAIKPIADQVQPFPCSGGRQFSGRWGAILSVR